MQILSIGCGFPRVPSIDKDKVQFSTPVKFSREQKRTQDISFLEWVHSTDNPLPIKEQHFFARAVFHTPRQYPAPLNQHNLHKAPFHLLYLILTCIAEVAREMDVALPVKRDQSQCPIVHVNKSQLQTPGPGCHPRRNSESTRGAS